MPLFSVYLTIMYSYTTFKIVYFVYGFFLLSQRFHKDQLLFRPIFCYKTITQNTLQLVSL